MTRSEFERRWQRRFAERGAMMDDDAGIAGWTATGLATRVRQFQALWERTEHAAGIWLDVGCGAGTYTRLLCEQGYHAIGIDYAVPSLFKARERSGAQAQPVGWLSADVQQLPLQDQSADGVLCLGVMQALADPGPALAELRRVLKPGGELWVDALNVRCAPTRLSEWRRARRGVPPHLRYDDPDGLVDGVRDAGFRCEAREWLPILPGRLQRWQPLLEAAPTMATLRVLRPLGELLSHSLIVRATRVEGDT